MNSEHADSVPHEFMDTMITVEGLNTVTDEQKLGAMLGKMPGVMTHTLAHGKVTIEYDPMFTTLAHLREEITRLGYGVGGVVSEPASPISDALHGHES